MDRPQRDRSATLALTRSESALLWVGLAFDAAALLVNSILLMALFALASVVMFVALSVRMWPRYRAILRPESSQTAAPSVRPPHGPALSKRASYVLVTLY